MKFPLLALLAATASAHTIMSTLFVNEERVGDGTCVRMGLDGSTTTAPIEGIGSKDMACGRDGTAPVKFTCPAEAGDSLSLQYRVMPDSLSGGALAANHKGPCAFYMKRVWGSDEAAAAGAGWFKIFEMGYDASAEKWCTEKMIAQGGLVSITVPSGLPPGEYLVRAELLALHQAYRGDPQFYVGCAQVFLTSGAESTAGISDIPKAQFVSIPGHVAAKDPGLTFNIFEDDPASYVIPGPKVWHPLLEKGAATKKATQGEEQGKIPDGCLLVNGNWCGVDPPDYSTESGCWDSVEDCYRQGAACYAAAPPTGSHNCDSWNDKCRAMEPPCKKTPFVGPQDKGEKITSRDTKMPATFPGAWSPNADECVAVGKKKRWFASRRRG
jgi:hypothetical protein